MNLSTAQRSAIRAAADGDPVPTRTAKVLVRRGYLSTVAETSTRHYSLTRLGRKAHAEIMASGDGPEDLKAMFRF